MVPSNKFIDNMQLQKKVSTGLSGVLGQRNDSMRIDPGHIQYVVENMKRPLLTARLGEQQLKYSEDGSGIEVIGNEYMLQLLYQTKIVFLFPY